MSTEIQKKIFENFSKLEDQSKLNNINNIFKKCFPNKIIILPSKLDDLFKNYNTLDLDTLCPYTPIKSRYIHGRSKKVIKEIDNLYTIISKITPKINKKCILGLIQIAKYFIFNNNEYLFLIPKSYLKIVPCNILKNLNYSNELEELNKFIFFLYTTPDKNFSKNFGNWKNLQNLDNPTLLSSQRLQQDEVFLEASSIFKKAKEIKYQYTLNKKIDTSYENIEKTIKAKIKSNSSNAESNIDKYAYNLFLKAIKHFKSLTSKYPDKYNYLLEKISQAYFHAALWQDSITYYEKISNLNKNDQYYKFSKKFNKIRIEYYEKKGYTKDMISKIKPSLVDINDDINKDIIIKVFRNFIKKQSNIKTLITNPYDIINKENIDDFNKLPLLQVYNEIYRKDIAMAVDFSFEENIGKNYIFDIFANNENTLQNSLSKFISFLSDLNTYFDSRGISFDYEFNKLITTNKDDEFTAHINKIYLKEFDKKITFKETDKFLLASGTININFIQINNKNIFVNFNGEKIS